MPSRLPGMERAGSARPSGCSVHGKEERLVRDPSGAWVCRRCFNEHVAKRIGNRSAGGILLPGGVTDDYFTRLMPNRAARRGAR